MHRPLAALSLLLAGCWRVEQSDVVRLDQPVDSVVITVDYGTVEIIGDDGETARVERDLACTAWNPPSSHVELREGTLRIVVSGDEPECASEHRVFVPSAVEAMVSVGAGEVAVSGVSGGLTVEVGDGDVSAEDVDGGVDLEVLGAGTIALVGVGGPIRATTGQGDVAGADLDAPDVIAWSGEGEVSLAVVAPITGIDARTGRGDVTVRVPAGDYALDLATGQGDTSIEGVRDVPSGARIHAVTDAGDVRVIGE